MNEPLPRVLLVDDDENLRRSFARALRRSFVIIEAKDGAEAVSLLERGEPFDAVLTDLEMPIMRGDELVRWIDQHRADLAGRVLILSAGAKDAERTAWLNAFDPSRVLRKPCTLTDLLAALSRVFDGG